MNTPGNHRASSLASLGERGLVQRIRERFPAPSSLLPVGIGDDAAVAVPEQRAVQVLTTDAMVEGVHFTRRLSSLEDVGYRALAVNVSDVAAMGATPKLALLSLILPEGLTVGDFDDLLDGFAAMAGEAGVALAGGNITRSPGPLIVDVTVVGSVHPRKVVTRAGGRAGDLLFVTGAIGAARAGLEFLQAADGNPQGPVRTGQHAPPGEPGLLECAARYRRPVPRVRIGTLLGRTGTASACMDLSDGLADAVRQLAESSGAGARIDAAALPIPAAARTWFGRRGADPVTAAMTGGDDYELLFAVPPRRQGRLRTLVSQARGVPITRIGELTAEPRLLLARGDRDEPLPDGFTHF